LVVGCVIGPENFVKYAFLKYPYIHEYKRMRLRGVSDEPV
jgi:hypothetical protein